MGCVSPSFGIKIRLFFRVRVLNIELPVSHRWDIFRHPKDVYGQNGFLENQPMWNLFLTLTINWLFLIEITQTIHVVLNQDIWKHVNIEFLANCIHHYGPKKNEFLTKNFFSHTAVFRNWLTRFLSRMSPTVRLHLKLANIENTMVFDEPLWIT